MPRKTLLSVHPAFAMGALALALIAPAQAVAQVGSSRPRGHGALSPADQEAASQLAREAQTAMQRGDFATAIIAWEKLVKLAPSVAETHANLGIAYYTVRRFRDAAGELRTAIKLKPALSNARVFLDLSLAKSGQCQAALPGLAKDYPQAPDAQLKRELGTQAVTCGMASGEPDKAVDALRLLTRDFASDPEVLYLASRVYSDLSTLASERLLYTAPDSYQAHLLNAEVLDLQGKFDDAAIEYRKLVAANPGTPDLHYRLGRVLLAGSQSAASQDEARSEFEAELKIDPSHALATYELGEVARRARDWNSAIEYFSRAAKSDPTLVDAFIGLGKSLLSAGRDKEAVEPLQRAVRIEPDSFVAHYELSLAYRHEGNDDQANQELAVYRELRAKQLSKMSAIASGMQGKVSNPQTADEQ